MGRSAAAAGISSPGPGRVRAVVRHFAWITMPSPPGAAEAAEPIGHPPPVVIAGAGAAQGRVAAIRLSIPLLVSRRAVPLPSAFVT